MISPTGADQGTFTPHRQTTDPQQVVVRQKAASRAGRKSPVSGILDRGGRVRCQIVKNGSKAKLAAIPQGKGISRAEITAGGLPACHGRVEAGFSRHHRNDKCADPKHPDFAENGVRIDSFQSHD